MKRLTQRLNYSSFPLTGVCVTFSSPIADILPIASSSSYTHSSVESRWKQGDIHDYCKSMMISFEQRWDLGQPFWPGRLLKAVDNRCVFLKQRGDYVILYKGLLSIFSQKAKCQTKISGTENLASQDTWLTRWPPTTGNCKYHFPPNSQQKLRQYLRALSWKLAASLCKCNRSHKNAVWGFFTVFWALLNVSCAVPSLVDIHLALTTGCFWTIAFLRGN